MDEKKRRKKWKKHSTAFGLRIKWKTLKRRFLYILFETERRKRDSSNFFFRSLFVWSLVCINCKQYSCLNVCSLRKCWGRIFLNVCGSKQTPKTPIIIWNWQLLSDLHTHAQFFSWLSHHQPNYWNGKITNKKNGHVSETHQSNVRNGFLSLITWE